jgi:sec-independent protein translocase protein TatB
MLRAMFGMGGTEILVILIVALLFLGPDKLPDAAKKISKGIRDIKKQSRALQQTIEDDEHIGGAIRDLKSALRGEEAPYRPPPKRKEIEAAPTPDPLDADAEHAAASFESAHAPTTAEAHGTASEAHAEAHTPAHALPAPEPKITLPPVAGEHEGAAPAREDAELAALVKPAPNTIARSMASSSSTASDTSPASDTATASGTSDASGPKHG